MSARAVQIASALRLLFGAVARWTTAWARLSWASGQPDELERVGRRRRHDERLRIGHADVLAGEDHHPADDEPGVLAGFEHPAQPVDRGVGVGAAHRLDERADDVVVVVAPVADRARAEGGLGVGQLDRARGGRGRRRPPAT